MPLVTVKTQPVYGLPTTPPSGGSFTTLGGWTNLGTLDRLNLVDQRGYCHMAWNSASFAIAGIWKPISGSTTIVLPVHDVNYSRNYSQFGIMIGEAGGAGKWAAYGPVYSDGYGNVVVNHFTNSTTFSSQDAHAGGPAPYPPCLQAIISGTNVTYSYSNSPLGPWTATHSGNALGFTPAVWGLFLTCRSGSTSGVYYDLPTMS